MKQDWRQKLVPVVLCVRQRESVEQVRDTSGEHGAVGRAKSRGCVIDMG